MNGIILRPISSLILFHDILLAQPLNIPFPLKHSGNLTATSTLSMYRNVVYFDSFIPSIYKLASLRYTITDIKITNGQDPLHLVLAGPICTADGKGRFAFEIGRKDSAVVAQWWKTQFDAYDSTLNRDPSYLNFGLIGKLKIDIPFLQKRGFAETFTIKHTRLAREGTLLKNYWWFAIPNVIHRDLTKDIITWFGKGSNGILVLFDFYRGAFRDLKIMTMRLG